jgi:uncharacterized protein (DUF952 family)
MKYRLWHLIKGEVPLYPKIRIEVTVGGEPMIYHITTERGWQIAREMGEYRAHSLNNEGFIHCSTSDQIPKVVAAFYQDQPDLLILAISPDQLNAPVKWEQPVHPNPENATLELEKETFPHIYGAINLESVIFVKPLDEFINSQN